MDKQKIKTLTTKTDYIGQCVDDMFMVDSKMDKMVEDYKRMLFAEGYKVISDAFIPLDDRVFNHTLVFSLQGTQQAAA